MNVHRELWLIFSWCLISQFQTQAQAQVRAQAPIWVQVSVLVLILVLAVEVVHPLDVLEFRGRTDTPALDHSVAIQRQSSLYRLLP